MGLGQPTEGKEATILDLSKDIESSLIDLQGRLDTRFDRDRKDEEARPGGAVACNVLDEIIKLLQQDKTYLNNIMSFIAREVLPKIS